MDENQWKAGSEWILDSVRGDGPICQRLTELGFIHGETVKILHRTPFGEPIIVKVRGTTVALRKAELSCLILK